MNFQEEKRGKINISHPFLQAKFFSSMSVCFFDNLGDEGFRDFLNECLSKAEHYGQSFKPGPAGKDGGIDAQAIKDKVKLVFQYKFHEISRYRNSNLQATVFGEFKKCIEKRLVSAGIKDGSIDEVIFITNVEFILGTRNKIDEYLRGLHDVELKFWDFPKLKTILQRCEENIFKKYFPVETADILKRIESKLGESQKRAPKVAGKKISERDLKKMREYFVNKNLRLQCYYALIYLLSPIEVTKDSMSAMRKFFDINKGLEVSMLKKLEKEGKIINDTKLRLIYINNKELALENFNKIAEKFPLPLNKLIELFL